MDDESGVKSVSGVKCQMPELRGEGRAVDLQARAESLRRDGFSTNRVRLGRLLRDCGTPNGLLASP